MNGASAMQYLSDYERNRSFRKYPCFVSTNGINLPSNQKENFNEDKIVFSYIGRYSIFHKGLDLIVDAIEQKEKFLRQNNCIFNFYGPHNEYYTNDINKLKNMIQKKGLSDLIFINESIIGEKKKNVLLNTDVFIQTSRFEGMPMGILEAMSYGVPCLITEGTTLTSLLEKYDAGWKCKTIVENISIAIENAVLEKNLLKQKSKNAIRLIEQEFLWNNVAKEALENYKNFI
jgi:glycosyltransferase involved in cell wall biosynthesis